MSYVLACCFSFCFFDVSYVRVFCFERDFTDKGGIVLYDDHPVKSLIECDDGLAKNFAKKKCHKMVFNP